MCTYADNMPLTIWVWKVDELLLSAVITLMTPIRGIEWRDKNNMLSIVCGTERVIFWSNDTISECSLANEQKGFNVNRIVWSGDYRKVLLLDKNSNLMYADMLDD